MTDVVLRSLRRITKSIVITPDDQSAYCGTTSGDILLVAVPQKIFKALGPEKTKLSSGVASMVQLKSGDLVVGTSDGVVNIIKPGTWKINKTLKVEGSVTSIALRGEGHEVFVGKHPEPSMTRAYIYIISRNQPRCYIPCWFCGFCRRAAHGVSLRAH